MSTDEHTPTPQEEQIYEALTEGDQDTIAELRDDAYSTAPEADTQPDEPTPAEQYEIDYENAYARYQADHEAPEDQREQQTAEHVDDENQTARSL